MKKKYDISITQQVAETIALEIVDDAGNPRDVSAYLFKMDCRQQPNSESAYFTIGSDDSTIFVDSSQNNKLWLVFKHELTKNLNFDKGAYDLIAYSPDKIHVEILMSGTVHLQKSYTRLS